MYIIKALVLDTFISYWHVLFVCAVLSNLRFRIGSKWILIAFATFSGFFLCSEVMADVDDKDFVYLVGALLRFIIASFSLAIVVLIGISFRNLLEEE